MDQQPSHLQVLEADQPPPAGTTSPPRQPKWNDTLAYIADPDRFCRTNLAQHGPLFKTSVFGGTTVFLGDARAIQMAFNGDLAYTEISLPPTTMEMFGEHSLFQRPDLHRQRKSALQPAFVGRMLGGYLPHMHRVIEQHLQTWDTTAPVPLVPLVEKACFDLLAPLLLGVQLPEHENTALAGLPLSSKAELKQHYKTFFDGFYGLLPWRVPFTAFGRGLQARTRLIEFMRSVIQQRRQAPLDPTTDFLAMMLVAQQEDPESVFSDALIENQCLLQLWASHYELMGLVSSWIYQLGHYPHWLERLRSEQQTILGEAGEFDRITLDHLKQMTLLDATIKETLRLLPPSSTANRRLTQSVVLDGVLYEKGWVLIAEPRLAHARSVYFTNPEQFEPDRFLPERGEGKLYEYIPFGGGVHACLGAQLAMTVMKVFAMHLLRRFDWKLVQEATFVNFPLKRLRDDYPIQWVPQTGRS